MEYTIVVHPDETGGYWTEVPALPGCGSQGETMEEAVEMTKDAIGAYLESLKAHGEPIPEDLTVVVKVTVAAYDTARDLTRAPKTSAVAV